MPQFWLYAFVTATGFVTAGLCTSFAELWTGRRLRFEMLDPRPRVLPLGITARVLAGPFIIMRNATKAALVGRPAQWLVLSTIIAVFWSFFSGVVILQLLFSFSGI